MSTVKDLGMVTAYAYAMSEGYTGTEKEFAELMASYATVAEQAEASATAADGSAKDSEAYAVGKRGGTDVGSSDPAYHNNAKYYANQAGGSATTASTKAGEAAQSASDASGYKNTAVDKAAAASADALKAEGYAVGKQGGTDVGSGSPYYHANAAYYSEQASGSATTASTQAGLAAGSATAAETAQGKAEAAQTAAETAQGKAEDAQEAAEEAAASVSSSAAQIATNTEDITQLKSDVTAIDTTVGSTPETTVEDHTWVIGGIKSSGGNDSTTKRLRLTDYTLHLSKDTKISCKDVIEIYVFEYSGAPGSLLAKSSEWGTSYITQNEANVRICVRLASDPDHVMTDNDLATYPNYVYVGESTGLIARVEALESGEIILASYYKAEADTTVQTVKSLLTEPCLVFPLITDIHYDNADAPQIIDKSIKNMQYVLQNIASDFVLNLGDNSDGDHGDGAKTLRRSDYVLKGLMSLDLPVYQAIGNHDTNYESSGTILTLAQCYRAYISAARDVVFNPATNGTDFYKDFDNLGIRLVVVNANYLHQYEYSADTATWLANTALNTDKIVVFATHQSPINTQNYNTQSSTNGDSIISALQAFVTGGGTLIQLAGHAHADYSYSSPWLAITSCCNKCEKADLTKAGYQAITGYDAYGMVAPDRTPDTASMDCWSMVIVRPIARKINLVRFGAGSDREYSF